MSFKAQWHRDKLKKKIERGFRGYPAATLAYYGPDDVRATKVAVGILASDSADPDPLRRWHSALGDVRNDHGILEDIAELLRTHAVKSVIAVDRIIGCPHEEGIDYPEGSACPQCPFWANRDRWTGELQR